MESEQELIQEFREAGLLWWINRQLHLWGWVIEVRIENGLTSLHVAKCSYEGFTQENELRGFGRLKTYMKTLGNKNEC